MAETTETQEYEVRCPDCGEEFDADIPIEALKPEVTDSFTLDCPECGIGCVIVYDAAKNAVGLTCSDDDDEEDEDDEEDIEDEDDEEEEEG